MVLFEYDGVCCYVSSSGLFPSPWMKSWALCCISLKSGRWSRNEKSVKRQESREPIIPKNARRTAASVATGLMQHC